jgi:hypothetical protein
MLGPPCSAKKLPPRLQPHGILFLKPFHFQRRTSRVHSPQTVFAQRSGEAFEAKLALNGNFK